MKSSSAVGSDIRLSTVCVPCTVDRCNACLEPNCSCLLVAACVVACISFLLACYQHHCCQHVLIHHTKQVCLFICIHLSRYTSSLTTGSAGRGICKIDRWVGRSAERSMARRLCIDPFRITKSIWPYKARKLLFDGQENQKNTLIARQS